MKAAQYAEALYQASIGKDAESCELLVANLARLLESYGHGSLLPAILRELEKLANERQSARESIVKVARRADSEKQRAAIEKDIQTIGASALPVHTVVDDTVVGGYEVTALGKRIDRTQKSTLLSLYTTLITNS